MVKRSLIKSLQIFSRYLAAVLVMAFLAPASVVIIPDGNAAAAADRTGPLPKPQKFTHGLLWKIEKTGLPASHVFGTIHLADPRVTALPEVVTPTLAQSKSFTMELLADESAQRYFLQSMLLGPGKNLKALLGDPLYRSVEELMEMTGIPPVVTASMKPWAVALNLINPMMKQGITVDIVLLGAATDQGMPIHQLETIQEQVEVFDGMPLDFQVAVLKDTVDGYALLAPAIERMVVAYLDRDLAEMWNANLAFMKPEEASAPHVKTFFDRVLFSRNRTMAQRMIPRLEEGGAFVALGALHLLGENGVLDLLEKQGYRVTPVY